MMRIILLLLIFIAAALGWMTLQQYDFPITAQFSDYQLETTAAKLGIVLLVLFILFYVFMRVALWLKNSPKRIITKLKKENEESGYKNIMLGFSALAAGDSSRAE
ncbi:MAG: heme biosynthesis HemY N-terminal domain-containing protein, partial [Rickettsiales bacterium]